MDKILTQFNSPTLANLCRMKVTGLRYYRRCLARLSKGELFYPFGLNLYRSNYEKTLEAVLWVISSLDKEVDPTHPSAICQVFFDLHFRELPTLSVTRGLQHAYIHNYFEIRKSFHVYQIKDARVFYQNQRKVHSVSLLGKKDHVEFESRPYMTMYHPFNLESDSEPKMHPRFESNDWQLVLARVLKRHRHWESSPAHEKSGIILPFSKQ